MNKTGADLDKELKEYGKMLRAALESNVERGKEYATAERDYRVALRKVILIERGKGTPVTIINDICKGDEVIANLRLARDIAEQRYKSSLEAINVYKTFIRVIENEISREYGR